MLQDCDKLIVAHSLGRVGAQEWNALAGTQPMLQHEYLRALETSGCATQATGWSPHHFLLYRNDQLVAAMPTYLKAHSRGEYVFDHAWAHAYARHGLPYYPRLLSAIPFTPVQGPRLLAHTDADRLRLAQAAIRMARNHDLSSWHVLFPDPQDAAILQQAGLMIRDAVQFHWINRDYPSMTEFLADLRQKHRKNIRQSRRQLKEAGVSFEWHEGNDIDDQTLQFFYRCYVETYIERGQRPYLTHHFFESLVQTMASQLLIVTAHQYGEPVASALFYRDEQKLYGRYWGCLRFVSGLHFETCYLQGIEYAIHNGLAVFEGGAQGEHKLARGLQPTRVCSAHWISHPAFAKAIDEYVRTEGEAVEQYTDILRQHEPFRQR